MADRQWRALHVYRWHGQDELLLDTIAPELARLGVSRFFYLRYWRGGPHLRLRVPPESFEALRAAVAAHLARHPAVPRQDGPGALAAQRELARLEGADPAPLMPQDTVREEPYEPEYAKYGGPEGVRIAEDLFHSSSLIALDAVRSFRSNPRGRIVTALDMLLAPLAAVGMHGDEAVAFLAGYHRFWSPYAPDQSSWPEHHATSEQAVAQVVRRTPVGPLARRWADAVAAAWARLGPDSLAAVQAPTDQDRRRLLLLNYLHTHNNRMGVTPAHEAYLAYLAYLAHRAHTARSAGKIA
ncbi:hypothetical protein E1258_17490 [Micromonospora sp. KC207]|uniref:thiopeptide-type bacteriocin biosynthesis protein n=1 Tax=Micromonospora sp. KC207 TaxID=2530377 RepID=UPI0010502EC4|nr:thiopeptide-type bacteriocin biosynthesis protein [Micromonospora sp. KC207]TDC59577.1 hypothetical protein E1258_17490 [Micromonospora sp. KC207]